MDGGGDTYSSAFVLWSSNLPISNSLLPVGSLDGLLVAILISSYLNVDGTSSVVAFIDARMGPHGVVGKEEARLLEGHHLQELAATWAEDSERVGHHFESS